MSDLQGADGWISLGEATLPAMRKGVHVLMSELVDPQQIEFIVGRDRHLTRHYGRLDPESGYMFILHSQHCVETQDDLRECIYSKALDKGMAPVSGWGEYINRPVHLHINENGYLVP